MPLRRSEEKLPPEIRRRIAQALLALGFTVQDTATALDVDLATARRDFDALGGTETFPATEPSPEVRQHTFVRALLAGLEFGLVGRPSEVVKDTAYARHFRRAIAAYTNFDRLRGIADGIAAALRRSMAPPDPPEHAGYRKLLSAVFEESPFSLTGDELLAEYLLALQGGVVDPPTRENFADQVVRWAFTKYAPHFRMPITAAAVRCFDEVLVTLTRRQEDVLRLRFALGCDKPPQPPGVTYWKFKECAEHFGFPNGADRVRQIEAKALRLLREPSRADRLEWMVSPPQVLVADWLAGCAPPIAGPPPDILTGPALDEVLTTPLESFELSVRTAKYFAAAGILDVLGLATVSEQDIWKDIVQRGFGTRQLRDIKWLTAGFGISLLCPECNTFHIGPRGEYPVRHRDGTSATQADDSILEAE